MSERVNLGDTSLHVVDEGSGDVLLLVHGFPLDHTMWRAQIEHFSESVRVIAPDLRGFGRSEAIKLHSLGMDQAADDLAVLLDRLEIDAPVTLCGLSMGGYIAWQFWQRHRAKLGRLVLCDTRAAADSPEVARGRQLMANQVVVDGAGVAADALLPKLLAADTYEQRPDLVSQLRDTIMSTSPAAIAAAQRGMADRPDVTDRLSHIDVPTLLICGAHDTISPPAEMQIVTAAIPGGQYVEIQAAGHMSALENPADVNAAIDSFLSDQVQRQIH